VTVQHPHATGSGHPVRTLWRSMSSHRRELAGAGVLGALASISAVALLGTSAWLIATAAGMPPVLTLTVAAVMVRFLALSRALFRYAERLVGHDAAFRGLTELRVVVYSSLERLAPTGLAAFGRGDLLARLVADVDAALDLPLRVILPWAQAVLVAAGTVAFLGWLLPVSGFVVGVLSCVALAVTPWLVARTARSAEDRMAPAKAELSSAVVRAFDGTSEITAFGAGAAAASRIHDLDDGLTRLSARESVSLGFGGGAGVLVQGAAVAAALAVAVPAVTSGQIEPVMLAVVALLPLALFDVLSGLPASALAYQRLRGSAVRIQDVVDAPTPVPQPASPTEVPPEFSGLAVTGATAHWTVAAAAIEDVDLVVSPGQRVAVVGPSGSGKSTLANVLMGFLPYRGSVRFSGVEVGEADGDELRQHVGMLTQQAHIFDTTIADNVRIGSPDATDDEVLAALEAAQLSEWVAGLPAGTATTVGSFGVTISGGERQRLALARLLIARRPFVILDEPTEHLDGPTADALSDTLANALASATVLTITHRLIGLESADLIVELQGGRVAARGTHAEHLARDGWYARQYRLESERQDMSALLPQLPVGRGVPGPVG
jgi:thiol reductant ABC exporter CydC subunit